MACVQRCRRAQAVDAAARLRANRGQADAARALRRARRRPRDVPHGRRRTHRASDVAPDAARGVAVVDIRLDGARTGVGAARRRAASGHRRTTCAATIAHAHVVDVPTFARVDVPGGLSRHRSRLLRHAAARSNTISSSRRAPTRGGSRLRFDGAQRTARRRATAISCCARAARRRRVSASPSRTRTSTARGAQSMPATCMRGKEPRSAFASAATTVAIRSSSIRCSRSRRISGEPRRAWRSMPRGNIYVAGSTWTVRSAGRRRLPDAAGRHAGRLRAEAQSRGHGRDLHDVPRRAARDHERTRHRGRRAGSAYVTGTTTSTSFPAHARAHISSTGSNLRHQAQAGRATRSRIRRCSARRWRRSPCDGAGSAIHDRDHDARSTTTPGAFQPTKTGATAPYVAQAQSRPARR